MASPDRYPTDTTSAREKSAADLIDGIGDLFAALSIVVVVVVAEVVIAAVDRVRPRVRRDPVRIAG